MIGRTRFSRETETLKLFIQSLNSNPDQALQPSQRPTTAVRLGWAASDRATAGFTEAKTSKTSAFIFVYSNTTL
jgi:hypothetical protein